jgi:hypothetical protein
VGDNMSESMGEYISESLGGFVGIGMEQPQSQINMQNMTEFWLFSAQSQNSKRFSILKLHGPLGQD